MLAECELYFSLFHQALHSLHPSLFPSLALSMPSSLGTTISTWQLWLKCQEIHIRFSAPIQIVNQSPPQRLVEIPRTEHWLKLHHDLGEPKSPHVCILNILRRNSSIKWSHFRLHNSFTLFKIQNQVVNVCIPNKEFDLG